jgi:hypothetical protein
MHRAFWTALGNKSFQPKDANDMTLRKIFSIVILMLFAAQSANAATIRLTMQLYDTSGNAISGGALIAPTSPNVYSLAPGQQFRVRVFGEVINPNFTDTDRGGTAFDNVPLGIQLVNGSLVTDTIGQVTPLKNLSNHWLNFNRRAGVQFTQPPFVNVADADSDGDLDVLGAAVGTSKLALEEPQDDPLIDGPELAYAQVGALGGPQALFQGWYQLTGPVPTKLSFVVSSPNSAQVFIDVASNTTSLLGSPASVISVPIYFGIPEPSTYMFAGIGLVGLVVGMRHNRQKVKAALL